MFQVSFHQLTIIIRHLYEFFHIETVMDGNYVFFVNKMTETSVDPAVLLQMIFKTCIQIQQSLKIFFGGGGRARRFFFKAYIYTWM